MAPALPSIDTWTVAVHGGNSIIVYEDEAEANNISSVRARAHFGRQICQILRTPIA